MHSDGTMRCGVQGCTCKKYNEGKDEKSFQERRCVCGHTKVNHIFNTRDHLFDKVEDEEIEDKINKCGSCGVETNEGKYWGTGTWLCDKCHDEWKERDTKMRGDDFSVSKSVIKKVKKGKCHAKKRVTTKLHENGEQSRLNVFDNEE